MFLLHTSFLSRLTASLCDAILAQNNSQTTLEQLELSQLFLFPLDDERQWYRYHQLFAEVLYQRLIEQEPEYIAVFQRRAAAWCEKHNLPDEAIGYALAARDFPFVIHLLEHNAEGTLLTGESNTVQGWLDALPESLVRTNPLLSCIYAFLLLIQSQFTAVEERLQDAERAIHQALLSGQHDVPPRLLAMIEVARSTAAISLGDPTMCITCAQRALELLEQDDLALRGVVLHNLGEAWEERQDLEAALQVYHESIALNCQIGNFFVAVTALGSLARIQIRQGKPQEARETCQRALRFARTSSGRADTLLPSAGKPMLILGQLLYEENDLTSALTYALQGIELSQNWMHQRHTIEGYLLLARVHWALGEVVAVHEAIQTAQKLIEEISITGQRQQDQKLEAIAKEIISIKQEISHPPSSLLPGQSLNSRELTILRLLANGFSNREIAEQLTLTTGTVKWYTHEIYSKLGTRSRTRAIAEARRQRIL